MKSPSAKPPSSRLFLHLIPSLIIAAVCAGLFSWNPFGHVPAHAYFDVLMRSDTAGEAQLLPDIDGCGLQKGLTISAPVAGGGQLNHLRFTVDAGRLLAFIFSPLDRTGEVAIEKCWLTSDSGEVLAMIPSTALRRYDNTGVAHADGAVHLRVAVAETITGLNFDLDPPIELAEVPPPPAEQVLAVFGGALLIFLTLSMQLGARLGALRQKAARVLRWCGENPRRAVFGAALIATALSCFPVVFAGKSFVSPNNGMNLLYSGFPTVPGAPGGRLENPMGSDMAATFFWHMPVSATQHRAIFEDHELPLWSRYNSGGLTLLGQGISMIGDPLHWLTIATGGAAWAWDLKFLIAKLLFVFAIGLLVWRTSRALPVALALTFSAPFIGFFAYRFCHAGFFAMCAAPWILLAWIEGAQAATLRRAALWAGVLLAANWWELNSGTAKEAFAFLTFLNAAGALGLLLSREGGWSSRLALFIWANVVFLLLSAPLWMVFLDALGKAYTVYDRQEIGQLQPGLAIGLFDDIFQRQLMRMEFLFSPSANFFVLLGVAWAAVRWRALRREKWLATALLAALPCAAIVFGVVPQRILGGLPMIRTIYHFDNTFSGVLFVLFFIIAGFGLREMSARFRAAEWTGDWAVVFVLTGVAFAGFLGMTEASHRVGTSLIKMGHPIEKSAFFWHYAALLLAALALLPWAARAAAARREGAAAWLGVALCAFVALHFRHGMFGETKFDLYTMNPKTRGDLRHVPSPALDCVRAAAAREPGRVVGVDWEMVAGFNAMLGLETISGPDALMDPAYLTLSNLLEIPHSWEWRKMLWRTEFDRLHRAMDFLNVRYFLVKNSLPDFPGTRVLGRFDLTVAQNETAWPRAFFTDAVIKYANGEMLRALIEQGDGRPFAAMAADDAARPVLPRVELENRAVAAAKNYRLTNNTTSFEIDASAPGLAVLQETNAPGDITVSVDGRPAKCLAVNHAFRGVLIEKAGPHVVKFSYRPAVLDRAFALGAAGLIALFGSAVLLLRRPRAARVAGTIPAKSEVRAALSTNP